MSLDSPEPNPGEARAHSQRHSPPPHPNTPAILAAISQVILHLVPAQWATGICPGGWVEKGGLPARGAKALFSQTSRFCIQNWLPAGEERDRLGVWDGPMHTEVYGVIGQQEPSVEHKELSPVFCDHLCGKRSEREWMWVHV